MTTMMRIQVLSVIAATIAFIAYQVEHNPKKYFPYCYVRQYGVYLPKTETTNIDTTQSASIHWYPVGCIDAKTPEQLDWYNKNCLVSEKVGQLELMTRDCLLNNGILTLATSALLILIPLSIGVFFGRLPGVTLLIFGSWAGILYCLEHFDTWTLIIQNQ